MQQNQAKFKPTVVLIAHLQAQDAMQLAALPLEMLLLQLLPQPQCHAPQQFKLK
jgi:hypothetical protein